VPLVPFLHAIKDYASWEVIAIAGGFLFRNLFHRGAQAGDAEKASKEAGMFLTPDGWQTGTRRFDDNAPIIPR